MNIYTFRVTKKHIVAAILILAALVGILILMIPNRKAEQTGLSVTIKSQEDCVQYLNSLGYEVDTAKAETKTVQIPKEFDAVYEAYNKMQQECGFDLRKYAGKKVELTTFPVTNWPAEEPVLLDVLVYRKKVIGGAVTSRGTEDDT